MKCDELKDYDYDPYFPFQSRGRFYDADEVEEAITELKEEIKRTQELANEQTFKLCIEKENVCQLEQLFQKQKEKADKLFHCLRCLVLRDLIKDCSEKEAATEIVKEFQ